MNPLPFRTIRKDGVVWVDSAHDAAYRKALMAGVPPQLRAKMQQALAATPDAGARAHSQRYFGAEAERVFADAAQLAAFLHKYLADQYQLRGLLDWLTTTNFGNDYRMIKVFAEWARMGPEAKTVANG